MRQIRLILLFALVATINGVSQSQPAATAPPAKSQSNTALVNAEAQSESIRILTPVSGQTLPGNFVNVHFEMVRPVLSGEPNYLIQLDGADPVKTSSTEHTFTELQPGTHVVRVTLVDANSSPIQGGAATVQFKVPSAPKPAPSGGSRGALQSPTQSIAGVPPAVPTPPELRTEGDAGFPLAGSPLPALSLIGFGLLIGGAIQTMRAR